jgi:hypothetical protein
MEETHECPTPGCRTQVPDGTVFCVECRAKRDAHSKRIAALEREEERVEAKK